MNNIDDGELIIIGETLEELEEDSLPRKKPVNVEDQYALDTQGRRRFHGAFTGGFSAGYFNSVDTKDGWKPNQFKSSRRKRAGGVFQHPEDFMDDEDTGEFGIASTGVRATNDFANHGNRGRKRERTHNDNGGPIPGTPVLRDLLETVTDTVGVRLLRKMGWKPGQGIGPRLTNAEKGKLRQKQTNKKIYGCSSPNKEVESAECDSETTIEDLEVGEGMLFAPDDLEPFQCKPKDNYFGIGYRGLNEISMLSGGMKRADEQIFRMQDRNKKLSIRGQAFGVGAFEADDNDIYELDDMTNYDFALQPEQRKINRWSDAKNCEPQRCSFLQGFVLADRRFERKKLSSPPNISDSFKPIHVIGRSRFSAAIYETNIQNRSNPDGRYISNKNNRIMSEDLPNDAKDLVQTYNIPESPIERNQILRRLPQRSMSSQIPTVAVKQQLVENCSSAENRIVASTPSWMDRLTTKSFVRGDIESTSKIPELSLARHEEPKSIDLANGTHDFGLSIGDQSNGFPMRLEGSTQSPKNKKVNLEILQLVSGDKSGGCEAEERTVITDSAKQTAILPYADTRINFGNTIHTPISGDSAIYAAKMKMYGKITRTINVWRPVNAVCKGFNVAGPQVCCAQPDTDQIKRHRLFECVNFCSGIITVATDSQQAVDTNSTQSRSNICHFSRNLKCSSAMSNSTELFESPKIISTHSVGDNSTSEAGRDQYSREVFGNDRMKMGNDGKTDAEPSKSWTSLLQQNDKAEAKNDLFKEIFLSCSEPSESDNESTDIHSIAVKSLLIGKSPNELNTQRNTSPVRGIFAQLNVNQATAPVNINEFGLQDPSYLDTNKSDIKSKTAQNSNFSDLVGCDAGSPSDVYGPELPMKLRDTIVQSKLCAGPSNKLVPGNTIVPKDRPTRMISVWVEKSKAKRSKKTKKKQKRRSRSNDRKHKYKSGKKNVH